MEGRRRGKRRIEGRNVAKGGKRETVSCFPAFTHLESTFGEFLKRKENINLGSLFLFNSLIINVSILYFPLTAYRHLAMAEWHLFLTDTKVLFGLTVTLLSLPT